MSRPIALTWRAELAMCTKETSALVWVLEYQRTFVQMAALWAKLLEMYALRDDKPAQDDPKLIYIQQQRDYCQQQINAAQVWIDQHQPIIDKRMEKIVGK